MVGPRLVASCCGCGGWREAPCTPAAGIHSPQRRWQRRWQQARQRQVLLPPVHRLRQRQQQQHQPGEMLAVRCSISTGFQAAVLASSAAAERSVYSQAEHMGHVYDRLAERVLAKLQSRGPNFRQPYMVGVAGVPGSGKSSLVKAVCSRLNQRGTPAVVVPMDGFHYYKHQLDQMPDPQVAHARRGAEWTFDASAYHTCLRAIKDTGEGLAPSFDHGVGDPAPADIAVGRHHQVVLSEGNYLLLEAEPWCRLQEVFDDTWYIDCPIQEAMQRVFERQTSNGRLPDVVRWRIDCNDRPNANQIETTRGRAALIAPNLPLP